MPKSLPNFAGTWELFAITSNGVQQKASPLPKPLVVTQNGATVSMDNRVYQISPSGTVGYQLFFAAKRQVVMADQADEVDTVTFRVEGSTLVLETTYDFRNQNNNHPPNREPRILNYRRIAP